MIKPTANYRILHFLSPVKWKGKMFLNDHDANWKVAKKTIDFLPQCHHFVLVPLNHTIQPQTNVTFVEYDYPRSVQINRCMFDYRNVTFDFKKLDVDFVFNHEPCHVNTIQNWFSTKRCFESVKFFNFYHWIDCSRSRGSSNTPVFYMRQLEAMTIGDMNFVHSETSMEYLYSNFKKHDYKIEIPSNKVSYMPLSGSGDKTKESNKYENVLVFNHRYNKSSGKIRFEQYLPHIPKKYKIWITDEKCKLKGDNLIIKSCNKDEYNDLMSNCRASLCFIDGYSTWNLSAQDSLIRSKPLIGYKHPMLESLLGKDYPYLFKNVEEFLDMLENAPPVINGYRTKLDKHDMNFKENLIQAMNGCWKDTNKVPLDAPLWMEEISKGNNTKKGITSITKPNLNYNTSNHYIRRHLLHNGYKDDYTSIETKYIKKGSEVVLSTLTPFEEPKKNYTKIKNLF